MSQKYITDFEKKFKNTISKYKLFSKKDKVFVACSGGKDSTTALYLLHKFGYDVEGLMIDLKIGKWSDLNLKNMTNFCKERNIKFNVINIRDVFGCSICYIRSGIQANVNLGNCTICGVMRRWLLNKQAREMDATKLVTGHNLDDEAENVMMNFFKGNPELFINLGPRTGALEDKAFVPRVKPLYFHTNAEIRKYTELKKFEVEYRPCPCSVGAFRRELRQMINELEKSNPHIKLNLVNNLLNFLPVLRKKYLPTLKLKRCDSCGEPSRNKICKRCELLKYITKE